MGQTIEVAEFIAGIGFKDFPAEAIGITKFAIIDSIGRMIGGIKEPVSQILCGFAKERGERGEAGVFGGGFRTSLTNATLINGTTAHCQEMESIGLYTGSNPMTNIPVAFSLADKFRHSGKEIVEGIIIGLEVQTKLGMLCPGLFDRGFSSIPTFGTLGATATACKMLNLNEDQIRNAFGVGISQCAGAQRQAGTMTHLLETGIGCRNGVTAALLAKEGMTADLNMLEEAGGFADLYSSGGKGYNLDGLGSGLGNPWVVSAPGLFIKKYGCCFFIHRALDALFELIGEYNIQYDEVKNVQVEVPTFIPKLVRFPDPKNGEEAKFSMEQALGAALIDRKATLPYTVPFTDRGSREAKYMEARKKVTVSVRQDWDGGRSMPWSLPVTVKLNNGDRYSKTIDQVRGGPDNPLTEEEFIGRYEVMTSGFLSSEQIKRSIDLALRIENLDNGTELLELITFGSARGK